MNPGLPIDELKKAILIGLIRSGKTKTFSQILEEAKISFDKNELPEVASQLEALDLIKAVSYQLPVAIRAELTSHGAMLARTFDLPEEDVQLQNRMRGMSDKNRSVFL